MRNAVFVCFVVTAAVIFTGCAHKMIVVTKTCPEEPVNVVITGFTDGSNMQKTEAAAGDVIVAYNGETVTSIEQLGALKKSVDTPEVKILLERGDEKIAVTIPKGWIGVYLREELPAREIDGDAVVIEGIGKLGWGAGMDNSFFGALVRIDEEFGEGVCYNDMMGLSGYAFRSNFFDGWCPSSPDATCGRDVGSELMARLGYSFEAYLSSNMDLPDFLKEDARTDEELLELIKGSIDSGWPVIAIDLIEVPEWGIITGYQNQGKDLFCRTYFDKTQGYEIAKKMPWVIFVITGKEDVDLEPEYRKSLETAKELYEIPKYENYFSGNKAIEEWIAALRNDSHLAALDAPKLEEAMHANWWIHASLYSARAAAGLYLAGNLEKFDVDTGLVEQLIEVYEKEEGLLKAGMEGVPSKLMGATAASWTEESRAAQAENLENFFDLEKKACEILAKISES